MSNRGLERGLKVRRVILASSIALTITVYLIITIIACIFGSNENKDGTYAEKLFNEVSLLKSVQFFVALGYNLFTDLRRSNQMLSLPRFEKRILYCLCGSNVSL